jgi:hypothetical protein
MWPSHTGIAGAFFIRSEEQEMVARKLVNMPDGMLAIIKTFPYRMVEYFHFWGLKDAYYKQRHRYRRSVFHGIRFAGHPPAISRTCRSD